MIGKGAVTILQWCVGLEGHPNTGGLAQNIGTYPRCRAPTDSCMFFRKLWASNAQLSSTARGSSTQI